MTSLVRPAVACAGNAAAVVSDCILHAGATAQCFQWVHDISADGATAHYLQ